MKNSHGIILSVCVGLFSLAGCASSSTRGAVEGLQIAEQMSLVTADSGSGTSSLKTLLKNAIPTGGDYVADASNVQVYVYDRSMEVLNTINDILCSVNQTQYWQTVNLGDHIVLIDDELCGHQDDHGSDQGSKSSGESKNFETWIVNSSRESDSSPQIVKFWIPEGPNGPSDRTGELKAQLTVYEEKSEAAPFGIFSLDFSEADDLGTIFSGNLSSVKNSDGLVEFELTMDGGEMFQEQTHAIITLDGSEGQAYAHRQFQGGDHSEEETVNVAFDPDHYLSDFGDDTVCLDRKNFRTNVWEYNLYDTAGTRVDRHSGTDIKSGDVFGWADYFGIWFPEDQVTVTNGLAVASGDGSTAYTIFKAGGRLMKRTRHEVTLESLIGDSFQMWDNDTGQTFIVKWDGTNLIKTAIQSCGEGGCTETDIPDETITVSPLQFVGLFKQGFGDVNIVVPESGVLSNDLVVPYHSQEFVAPSADEFASGDLVLKCYSNCLAAPLTADLLNAGNPFLPNIEDNTTPPYVYTISADDMTLKLQSTGEAVTMDEGISLDSMSPNFWGASSGEMIPNSQSLDNFWEVWDQEITYTYETGPNSWNKYMALLDSTGKAVEFEKPLDCVYKDDTYGTFLLNYHGVGRLFGIPFDRIESEDGNFEIWRPRFAISDGTDLECDGSHYVTRAMSMEQNMEEVDSSECSSLTIEDVGAPTNSFTDPKIGDIPTVTDPPAVIGGVVQ